MHNLHVGMRVEVIRSSPDLSHLLGRVCTLKSVFIDAGDGKTKWVTDIPVGSIQMPFTKKHYYYGQARCFKPIYDGDQPSHWDAGVWKPESMKEPSRQRENTVGECKS